MAAPATYSEQGLFLFMRDEMQEVGRALNWNNQVDYQPAIDETLLSFGAGVAVASITDIRLLRARARVYMWHRAAQATAGDYDFSADGGTYSRKQIHDHAVAMLLKAQSEAALLDGDMYAVIVEERAPLTRWWNPISEKWEWY